MTETSAIHLRQIVPSDLDAIIRLSLLAWEPVFDSFRRVLGEDIFLQIYPDWPRDQERAVRGQCTNASSVTWLAETDLVVTGFVSWEVNEVSKIGEVHMLAVHPDHQRQGIGGRLNELALVAFKDAGMTLAVVGTGGDPGHAPARRSYERAGYTALPIVRYYKTLTDHVVEVGSSPQF
ncbi:MAG: GNAT family N-acetyltransferase [Thermomicrobiales bacterium]